MVIIKYEQNDFCIMLYCPLRGRFIAFIVKSDYQTISERDLPDLVAWTTSAELLAHFNFTQNGLIIDCSVQLEHIQVDFIGKESMSLAKVVFAIFWILTKCKNEHDVPWSCLYSWKQQLKQPLFRQFPAFNWGPNSAMLLTCYIAAPPPPHAGVDSVPSHARVHWDPPTTKPPNPGVDLDHHFVNFHLLSFARINNLNGVWNLTVICRLTLSCKHHCNFQKMAAAYQTVPAKSTASPTSP